MTDTQFTTLLNLISAQNDKFDVIYSKFDAIDRSFERLARQMNDGFVEIKTELATKASIDQLNSVYNLLDANIREHEKQEVERAAMNHQLNRHEK
jgi:hypothetical protein